MNRFLASCASCQWEGRAADDHGEAIQEGLAHLMAQHAPLAASNDLSLLRIWQFDQPEREDLPPPPEPEPEPAPPAIPPRIGSAPPQLKREPRAQARRKDRR
jgi:hypothetical protein